MGLVKNLSIGILGTGFIVLATAAQAKAVTLTYDRSIGSPGFWPWRTLCPSRDSGG